MSNPFHTPFAAIFCNELLLNTKRVAPYVLMLLFSANAVLWWGWGPAVRRGWATNSDFYIARNLKAFSFLLGLPIFNAVIMGDPVIRDFRLGIDPLIFSKPINRAQYLLGKFFGSFSVLVCCQAAFPVTLLVLQIFRPSQMVVQQAQVLPYFKHFLFFVVITHLTLAALYFAVGALTRNSKIVYGLAISFYPIFLSSMLFLLRPLTVRWRSLLDPFLLNSGPSNNGFGNSADFLNSYVVNYTPDMFANRVLLILTAAICLTVLYVRFRVAERPGNAKKVTSVLSLSTAADQVYYDSESLLVTNADQFKQPGAREKEFVRLPKAARADPGIRADVNKLIGALGVELRLLLAERSLMVLGPLIIFLSMLDLAFYKVVSEVSYSAVYASSTASALLLFILGLTVFYTGEAMHRDSELRIMPLLWAAPIPNSVLLFSKFLATLLLDLSLVAVVGAIAIATQIVKGDTPVSISAYLITYSLILLPSIVFILGASVALNVLLRDKYLVYALSIGISGGLFYLYSVGYNHWLYNPLLYHLLNFADLTGAGNKLGTILTHRLYCLAIASTCLSFAHLFFQRKSTKLFQVGNRLSGPGWPISIALVSVALAAVTGWIIISSPH
jgi:ABC-type transport system involved in multi-copper enzyme maturation permease subunit